MPIKQRKVLVRLDPSYKKCPSCGEINVLRRSRAKNVFENLLKFTSIYKMYRCRKCNWRGPLSTIIITAQSIKNLFTYIVLLVFIYFLMGQIIKVLK